MKVQLLRMTERPAEVISSAAGTSYGKEDYSFKRIKTCFNKGHLSVFEHVDITWRIEGISRSCSHQLVRHRLASFTEKSLRYTKIKDDDWYVIPEGIKQQGLHAINKFKEVMKRDKETYFDYIDSGIKPEDARFALPLATKTDVTTTMNLREFLHFLDLRLDPNAQWEIRELASKMMHMVQVRLYNVGAKDLSELIFSKYKR